MNDYGFKLTPGYCLYNGVAVLEQHGACIRFLLENISDELLKARLKRAFTNHIELMQKQKNCPEEFRRLVDVSFEKGSRSQLRKCVLQLYKADSQAVRIKADEEIDKKGKEVAAVLLLDSILSDARVRKATDIHIEENCIRFRINGRLEKQLEIQKEKSLELVQRIKLLAGMNVIEKRKSQDGHFVYGNQNPVFVRVSSVCVVGSGNDAGESVVMRLLDTRRIPLALGELGLNSIQLEKMDELMTMRNGLILVCGPTGSGKSTTVASMLVEIGRKTEGSVKIISLEDPPEYKIPNVTQIKIDEQNTFKNSLEHIFRQDPDVIMIGEIRDEESAAVALRASLTGHLVFATLHTGSAGEAFLRMENLGVERNLLCSVLRGVICQELGFSCDSKIDSADGRVWLYADVSLPQDKESIIKAETEDEINMLFEHVNNYQEILNETVKLLAASSEKKTKEDSESEVLRLRKRLPYYKGGKGELKNEGIYGRIV